MRGLLRVGDYRLYWSGQTISAFGDALTNLALLLTAQRLTGSTAAVAGTAIAIALPSLLFGLIAGVYVDRWNRKRITVLSDSLRALLVLGFLLVDSPDRMWLLYFVAFVQAAIGIFDEPAKTAMVPEMVGTDQLLAANSLSQTAKIVAGVVGTGAAGLIAGLMGSVAPVFVVDGVTFALSAFLMSRLSLTGEAPGKAVEHHFLTQLRQGLALLRSSRPLLAVLLAATVVMLGLGAVNVLLVPFVVEDLSLSETWFGPLEAAQVSAMVIAGALVTAMAARLRSSAMVMIGLGGAGIVVGALAAANSVWHLMGLLFLVGLFVTPAQAGVSTIVQTETPPALLGRAGASLGTMITAANVTSMALAGGAAAFIGVRGVFLVGGALTMAAALLAGVLLRSPVSPPATVGQDTSSRT
ncbi:MAG: MFS transporter [Actinomycetota bacterium]